MKNFPLKLALAVFIFSLILSADSFAQVKTWGYNGYGQLGNGNTDDQAFPVEIGINQTTGISGGCYHTLFLQADGTVLSVGDNEYGQLGDGTIVNKSVPVQVPGHLDGGAGGGGLFSFARFTGGRNGQSVGNELLWASR